MDNSHFFETIVLDVDGGVVPQNKLIAKYNATIIPLREKSASLRFWCHQKEIKALKYLIVSACRTTKPKAIFYGSGDYHHLAYLGISLIEEPTTIIHFDNHSDYWREGFVKFLESMNWWKAKEYFNYGSWVNPALRLPNIRKVVQFGIDGDFQIDKYIFFPKGRLTHSIDHLLDAKIETYPNKMKQAVLLGRIKGSLPSVEFKPGLFTTKAIWKNMQDNGGVETTVRRVLPTIATESVYITIDKDVLNESENFAAYPGFSGTMTANELILAVAAISREKRIIGLDVCGDASDYEAVSTVTTFGKKVMAQRQYKNIPPEDFCSTANIKLNESVNLKIMEAANQSVD